MCPSQLQMSYETMSLQRNVSVQSFVVSIGEVLTLSYTHLCGYVKGSVWARVLVCNFTQKCACCFWLATPLLPFCPVSHTCSSTFSFPLALSCLSLPSPALASPAFSLLPSAGSCRQSRPCCKRPSRRSPTWSSACPWRTRNSCGSCTTATWPAHCDASRRKTHPRFQRPPSPPDSPTNQQQKKHFFCFISSPLISKKMLNKEWKRKCKRARDNVARTHLGSDGLDAPNPMLSHLFFLWLNQTEKEGRREKMRGYCKPVNLRACVYIVLPIFILNWELTF